MSGCPSGRPIFASVQTARMSTPANSTNTPRIALGLVIGATPRPRLVRAPDAWPRLSTPHGGMLLARQSLTAPFVQVCARTCTCMCVLLQAHIHLHASCSMQTRKLLQQRGAEMLAVQKLPTFTAADRCHRFCIHLHYCRGFLQIFPSS